MTKKAPLFEIEAIVCRKGAPYTGPDRMVALAIAFHFGRNTEAWPSQKRIQEWTGLGQTVVWQAIRRLSEGPNAIFEREAGGPCAGTRFQASRYRLRALDSLATRETRLASDSASEGDSLATRSPLPRLAKVTPSPRAMEETNEVLNEETSEETTSSSGATAPDRRARYAQAQEVFAYWQRVLEHPTAKFTQDRRRKVEARLREGYTVTQLCQAVDGCQATPHNMGENETGQRWDDLALICRNGSNVERFVAAAPERPTDPAQRKRLKDEEDDRVRAAVNAALDQYEADGYDRAALRKHAVDAHKRREDPVAIMARAVRMMTPRKPEEVTV